MPVPLTPPGSGGSGGIGGSSNSSSGLSSGATAGIVIAVLAGALLFFIGFLYRRKIANACASKKQNDNFEETNTKNPLSNFDKLDEDDEDR